jgi:GNAT superfamily N-acetyltransferase
VNAVAAHAPVVYGLERIEDVLEEIRPLLATHWEEIAHYRDLPLDPDWDKYRATEERGALRIFTARIEGRMVGYLIYIVTPGLHYRSTLQATQDIYFVVPEHRGGLGRRLLRFADACLKEEGVQVIYQHVKAAHNFGPMLERQGYVLIDLIYGKRL